MDQRNLKTTADQIERLAYHLWEERGRPDGSPDEDWYRAERYVSYQAPPLSDFLTGSQLPFASIRMGF